MNFLTEFRKARSVGTPLIKVNTPDPASTITHVRNSIKSQETTPLAQWDGINGLKGLNDKGGEAVAKMLAAVGIEQAATTQLPLALQVVNNPAHENLILFLHNPHLWWDDPQCSALVIQGLWNLRDTYKANAMMCVSLTELGTVLPATLNNDILSLEEALPTRPEIKDIMKGVYTAAGVPIPSDKILEQCGDALSGIAAFPCEQAASMQLDRSAKVMDISGLWLRKKNIVSATNGLSFSAESLTLKDMGGNANISQYGSAIMTGKRRPKLILRIDEIEKAFAGAGTDTSGVKGDLLGNFLTWVEDKKVFCILLLGVPGASKSHFIYCLGGSHEIPVVNFDIAGMQDSLVGNSGKNLRKAESTVEAISDGEIVLFATANSLRGLPAELLSRFEKGGIFFFDAPTHDERVTILDLKIKKYNISAKQAAGFTVEKTEGWTGREIDSLCDKADRLDKTLLEAAEFVIPLTVSQHATIEELRASATNKYLSASKSGRYSYTPKVVEVDHAPVSNVVPPTGQRKFR